MHLHQKDKIQSLLHVLRSQPNLASYGQYISPFTAFVLHSPFLKRIEGGVDDLVFLLEGRDLELRPPQAD